MADLTKKYRLIWDPSTKYIQNDYNKDWSGTLTKVVGGNMETFESDDEGDIGAKIGDEELQEDPSLNF